MKRIPLLAFRFAGAGIFALALGACSGPDAPPGDAGFGSTTVWSTGGSTGTGGYVYGTGGSYGTGGTYGGTGGSVGGGNTDPERRDGGGKEERRRDGGDQGGGGKGRDIPDGGIAAVCPPGAANGAVCMVSGLTCAVQAGDGGKGEICRCKVRGGSGSGSWTCEQP